jgi:hypothetical protein
VNVIRLVPPRYRIPKHKQNMLDRLCCLFGIHMSTAVEDRKKPSMPRLRLPIGGIDRMYCRRCGVEWTEKWSVF